MPYAIRLGLAPLMFAMLPFSCNASDAFGVVSTDGKSTCLATARMIDSFPIRVQVVLPGEPQRVRVGVITASLEEPCGALAKRDLDGHFYSLRPIKGLEALSFGVAQINGQSKAGIRACTSSEGVHLTAWNGKPLAGERLWHQYIYLGYDVEPTCSEQDYEE